MTVTQALNTTTLALAIPGYMNRAAEDYLVFENQELGRGATAVIYRGAVSAALEKELGYRDIAVKVFQAVVLDLRDVKFELALLSALQKKSKHILELVGYCETHGSLQIILKLYENGTLGSKIHDQRFKYPEGFVVQVVNGIIQGMKLVHSHGIVHFDIKPANILLDADFSPVISDFGMAKTVGSSKNVSGLASSTVSGYTPNFAAPELFFLTAGGMALEIDKKVDVYAFAITVWELLHRTKVWNDTQGKSVHELVTIGERPSINGALYNQYPQLINLMQQCWNQIPFERPAFSSMPVFQ